MPITSNPRFINAYRDYMDARKCVTAGTMGNAAAHREQLRAIYRLLAGKPL